MATTLHAERLDTVVQILRKSGAETILDLGCGAGELLLLLAGVPQFKRIVGIDTSLEVLQAARYRLSMGNHEADGERLCLYHASFTTFAEDFVGFDAVALIETIEHIAPGRLSAVEQAVFCGYHPKTVLISTPNREYNILHGMAEGDLRHPDHRFEWTRDKFRHWATGVADRHGYTVGFEDIGEVDQGLGGSTQLAFFTHRATI